MRKLIRVAVAATALAMAGGLASAAQANAYQLPGSTWTWHGADDFKSGLFGVAIDFEDTNYMNNLCNHFTISGSSVIDSRGAHTDGLELSDEWKFDSASLSISGSLSGVGVSVSPSSGSVKWDTSNHLGSLGHYYAGGNSFSVSNGLPFGQIAHTETGKYTVGGEEYQLQSRRNEHLC
ncbi:hypothetical protein [Kutzneria sp. CA-103260]|uniref:hypothetical protein n=1 Tax=Kutzneria sp. CA-103260 TaxID=2802641 RepID=UPI001BAA075A|nr:hypothetical protein [Kutzneria sp. CA-103260]QUQ67632.1 hypothetical protein JJ691_53670 [Kutzneria sp. CA-103260]